MPTAKKTPRLSSTHKALLQELYSGGVLRRKDMKSLSPDRNYWNGEQSSYMQEPRSTANRLTELGLACWHPYSEAESQQLGAELQLRLTEAGRTLAATLSQPTSTKAGGIQNTRTRTSRAPTS